MNPKRLLLPCLALLGVVAAPGPATAQQAPARQAGPILVDVTREAGISFTHSFGDQEMSSILEATGPGCAFFDYDQDGHLDIYVVNGAHLPGINDPLPRRGTNEPSPRRGTDETDAEDRDPAKELYNRLFRSNGDGTFTDVTAEAGVGDTGYGMGVVVGDYDNDGDPDIFLANYGPNVLLRNNGAGAGGKVTFTDVTEKAGVRGPEKLKGFPKWSLHGSFFDYDREDCSIFTSATTWRSIPSTATSSAPRDFPGRCPTRASPISSITTTATAPSPT